MGGDSKTSSHHIYSSPELGNRIGFFIHTIPLDLGHQSLLRHFGRLGDAVILLETLRRASVADVRDHVDRTIRIPILDTRKIIGRLRATGALFAHGYSIEVNTRV